MKIVKNLSGLGLLLKAVSETIQMKQKNKKKDFLACY